jgi:hypothetical protein
MRAMCCINYHDGMKIIAFIAALCCGSALAASTTTDFTDLWFNPNEEGWGANVIHQRDTLFITLFVYGPNTQPTWYVASQVDLASTANGVFTYTGQLYKTTGPHFNGPFNGSNVAVTPAGTISFAASQINQATLTYVADGVQVSKSLTRQTWRSETLAGNFGGVTLGDWTDCGGRSGHTEAYITLAVAHANSSVSIVETGQGYSCTYNGTYTQAGRMGTITGTGTCTDSFNPTFTMSEVEISANALSMRVTAESGTCRMAGRMGGIRR